MNLDWHLVNEENKLWARTRDWWEHLHISFSHNTTSQPEQEKQYGGTALFTINDMAHRAVEKGRDASGLDRWSWAKLRGKDGHILVIISAYRPTPPSAGVMGTYAQHSRHFNSIDRDICPREAFILDLKQDILVFLNAGHHIIVMLDANEDMRRGQLSVTFQSIHLREVILQRHGHKAPSTYRRNTKKNVPIDGIWASPGVHIKAGGYFSFDEVISGTDHRTLWIDVEYKIAFGHDGSAPIIRPSARKLHNRNPNIRDNFNYLRKKYADKCDLGHHISCLEKAIEGEFMLEQINEYEKIDNIRRNHLRAAENRCRKLRKGNVEYSDVLQDARNKVEGWSLLLRYNKGLKVSSRKLTRTLKKAGIPLFSKTNSQLSIVDELKAATKSYYESKKSHKQR
jgi:hypothetical protein